MRLLLLSSEFPPGPGGIGTHAAQIAAWMAKFGHQVLVITPQDYAAPQEITEFNRNQPYQIIPLPKHNRTVIEALARIQTLNTQVRKWKPDVLLSTGARSNWLVYALRTFRRTRWISVGHGSEFGVPQWWERLFTRLAFNRADQIVCVSRYTRSRMLEMGIHPGREVIINNGADPHRFSVLPQPVIQNFRSQHALTDKFVLLTVGNVTSRKGHDLVIRALPGILRAGVDVHYLVIGLPTQQALMKNLAAEIGVADRVSFFGTADQDTIIKAYNACDVYIMPSRTTPTGDFEGYGIVVTEAGLCGKAAIVTRESGLEDAVIHDETGILVPQEHPDAICTAVLRLAFDRPLLERLSRSSQQRAITSQTWEHVACAYQNLLNSMLRSDR